MISLLMLLIFWVYSLIDRIIHPLRQRHKSRQLKIVNRYRRKYGLHPLKAYYALDRIARGHSKYMARHHTCNHAGFSHRAEQVRRLTHSGSVGENCYEYPASHYNKKAALSLVRGWMESPGHRHNLLHPNYSKIGIGIATRKGYIYATQIFSG